MRTSVVTRFVFPFADVADSSLSGSRDGESLARSALLSAIIPVQSAENSSQISRSSLLVLEAPCRGSVESICAKFASL